MRPLAPALAAALLAAGLAGCLGTVDDGGGAGPAAADGPMRRLGQWKNPDRPIVDAVTYDADGDGYEELYITQRNGSVTALRPLHRNHSWWQVEVPPSPEALSLVDGRDAPRLAVAAGRTFSFWDPEPFKTRMSLLNLTDGAIVAEREIRDLVPWAMVATDLTGDGVDDLVLAGRSYVTGVEDPRPEAFYDRMTLVAVDGSVEGSESGGLDVLGGESDELWRAQLEGGVEGLWATGDPAAPVAVATDERIAALDNQGRERFSEDAIGLDAAAYADGRIAYALDDALVVRDLDGRRVWNATTDRSFQRLALRDVAGGVEVLAAHHSREASGLVAYRDGDLRFERNLTFEGHPSGVAFGQLRSAEDPHILIVAPAGPDGQARLHELAPDGTPVRSVRYNASSARDHLILADLHPWGALDPVVATGQGYVHFFGTP